MTSNNIPAMDDQSLMHLHAQHGVRERSLLDHFDMVVRRKKPFLLALSLVLAITLSLVFGLPSIYRSQATISIQQQEISEELVKSTITSYAEERIQEISKRIMTDVRLSEIITKLNLYSDYRDELPMEAITQKMRDRIHFKMSNAVVKGRGVKKQPNISFTASFDYPKDPQIAQKVAMEIADLFLKENKNDRKRQTENARSFLLGELKRFEDQAIDIDLMLVDFKKENAGKLPEQSDMTLRVADRLERDIAENNRQLFDLRQQNIITLFGSMLTSQRMTRPFVCGPK